MPVPDAVRTAVAPPVRVESQKLADGVWLLGGGTHNSLLVEFKDYRRGRRRAEQRGALAGGDRGGRRGSLPTSRFST